MPWGYFLRVMAVRPFGFQWSVLHAPAPDRLAFDGGEDDVLDEQADQDDGEQTVEDIRRLELVAVLEDEPAEAARARRDAEDELGRDQGAPGEGPADLEAGQDRREGGGDQDQPHQLQPAQAVVLPDHAQRVRDRAEAGVG